MINYTILGQQPHLMALCIICMYIIIIVIIIQLVTYVKCVFENSVIAYTMLNV